MYRYDGHIPPSHPSPYVNCDSFYPSQMGAEASQQMEESYIENILRLNIGKVVTIYLTYENNREWNAKVVTGTLRAAGRDYLLLRDRESNKDFLFRMINVDYFVFDDIAFTPPEQG